MAEEIFSNMGNPGTEPRQDGRLYHNAVEYFVEPEEHDPTAVITLFDDLREQAAEMPEVTRIVFRGILDQDVLTNLRQTDLAPKIEVALPLREFGQHASLVYLAENNEGRDAITPIDEIIAQSGGYIHHTNDPLTRVREVREKGYTFDDSFSEADIDDVEALWRPTFGWNEGEGNEDQIHNLAIELAKSADLRAAERRFWFSAIRERGRIVSLALAERTQIPGQNGLMDVVESTEWRTDDTHKRSGLMAATLVALNARVLRDLRTSTTMPLIFAECNFTTRSDIAGNGSGLFIPYRNTQGRTPAQVLVQNVSVNDGEQLDSPLRDFNFMYMPRGTANSRYAPDRLMKILDVVGVE